MCGAKISFPRLSTRKDAFANSAAAGRLDEIHQQSRRQPRLHQNGHLSGLEGARLHTRDGALGCVTTHEFGRRQILGPPLRRVPGFHLHMAAASRQRSARDRVIRRRVAALKPVRRGEHEVCVHRVDARPFRILDLRADRKRRILGAARDFQRSVDRQRPRVVEVEIARRMFELVVVGKPGCRILGRGAGNMVGGSDRIFQGSRG